jgi:hypothetical protein
MEQKPGDVTSLNADYPAGCFQVLYVSNASYSSTDFSVSVSLRTISRLVRGRYTVIWQASLTKSKVVVTKSGNF